MTSIASAPALSAAGSVLAVWSIIVAIVGVLLFGYSIVVTRRARRGRRRGRRAGSAPATGVRVPRPRTGDRKPLPTAATVGGREPSTDPREPLALPAGPQRRRVPMPPPPARIYPMPHRVDPIPVGATPAAPPPAWPPVAPGVRSAEWPPTVPGAVPVVGVPVVGLPPRPDDATTIQPAITDRPSLARGSAFDQTAIAALPAYSEATMRVAPDPVALTAEETVRVPPASQRAGSSTGRGSDPCAALWAECDELVEIANTAAAAAASAATAAEARHAEHAAAQRDADEARRAHQRVSHEVGEIAARLADLDREPSTGATSGSGPGSGPGLEETTHAAFAAYRRGDLTSDELREVFRRAEGWTPDHDRFSRRVTELRAEETDLARTRDSAVLREEVSSERARDAALAAHTLQERAHAAAGKAQAARAAAQACTERSRRSHHPRRS